MKHFAFILLLSPLFLQAQGLSYKIGGVTFQDCLQLATFNGQEIVNLHLATDGTLMLNADIYNEAGRVTATVRDNIVTGRVTISQSRDEIKLIDLSTQRVICRFLRKLSPEGKPIIEANLDYYLPDGRKLECTPDIANVATLQVERGLTVMKRPVALPLH